MQAHETVTAFDIDKVDSDIVHEKEPGVYCNKGVKKVIDNEGRIRYQCSNCGKRWDTGDKATPENGTT
jgi:hypothetical protein